VEAVPLSYQFPAQLLEIVDLTIESEPYGSVFIAHRLAAVFAQVDDTEATMSQADRTSSYECPSVRTAMNEAVVHCPESVFVGGLTTQVEDTGNAAHQQTFLSASSRDGNGITRR
jgi:hypothetical protein